MDKIIDTAIEDNAADALRDMYMHLRRAQQRMLAARFPGNLANEMGVIDAGVDCAINAAERAMKKLEAP